jgi:hypothetical protein
MNNRKKITVFSLGYDKCADILFDDIIKLHQSNAALAKKIMYFLSLLSACKNVLMNLLDHLSTDSDAVELYVGSDRQNVASDESNAKKNNNGSCFKNYAYLCQQKNWIFRKFLLSDAQVNDTSSKAELIAAQFNDIKNNYAGKNVDIDFYFIDADSKNIYHNELADIYSTKPLPANIKHFSLIKFDWYDLYTHKNEICCGTLLFHTRISQSLDNTVQPIRSEKNCWNQFISLPPIKLPEPGLQASVRNNSLAISSPLKPKKVVVISLDYDACASILFDDIIKPYQSEKKYASMIDKLITSKNVLMNLLDRITSDANSVELYVGSNRQDISADEYIASLHNNGLCFQNYADLCQQKNWTFRKFLLADAQIDLPAGTTMHNRNVLSFVSPSKTEMIEAQLKDIENNYCDAEVDIDFYFIDDDSKNIYHNELADTYSFKPFFAKIRNFSLIKFAWNDDVHKDKAPYGTLNSHTRISQSPNTTLQIIQNEENIWETFIPQACDESLNETTPSSTMTILSVINNSHTHDNSSLVAEPCNTNTQINSPETELSNEAQPSATDHAEDFPKIGCPSW